jgi:hypothetical protein
LRFLLIGYQPADQAPIQSFYAEYIVLMAL